MTGSFLLVPHIQNLLAWYGLWLILITGEISKFFGILHICRMCCFAIQSHSDGKCRSTLDVLATSPDDYLDFGLD